MIICILGPPGAGKTTQVKELVKSNKLNKMIDLSVPKLCKHAQNELSEFLTEEEKLIVEQNLAKVNENRENGQLFPIELDRILLEIAIRLSYAGINIILEGYPRGVEQAKLFIEKMNSNHLRDSLKLICLNFNDHELELIKKRQFERAISDYSNIDESIKRIGKILPKTQVYMDETKKGYKLLVENQFVLKNEDANQEMGVITKNILNYIDEEDK